jgi:hypothetical protein
MQLQAIDSGTARAGFVISFPAAAALVCVSSVTYAVWICSAQIAAATAAAAAAAPNSTCTIKRFRVNHAQHVHACACRVLR